jgi:hypothetical protein
MKAAAKETRVIVCLPKVLPRSLRFLQLESHPLAHALAKIPVRLFTMGSPLR